MDEHVGAEDESPSVRLHADVTVQLLDAPVQPGIVERNEIERADAVAVGKETARQVQAQEARAAGDRDEHEAES
jgi:hypothetical protein